MTPPGVNFGVRSVHSTTPQIFEVTNTGESPAIHLQAGGFSLPAYEFRGGEYPGIGGDCGNVLEAGATCRLSVSFRPTTVNRFQESGFHVRHNEGAVQVPMDGRGTNIASLRISNQINDNDYYSFGTVVYGTQTRKKFTVEYSGARPATGANFSGITLPFLLENNTCPQEITADCEFEIVFQGTAESVSEQSIKLTYHNGSYAAETRHGIYGHTSAQITPAHLEIQAFDFGTRLVNRAYQKALRVKKRGTLPATGVTGEVVLASAFSFVGGNYPGTGGTCAETITTDCTIVVQFHPTRVGEYREMVELGYHDGERHTQARRNLNGRGATTASLTLYPKEGGFDYGEIPLNQPVDHVFVLKNDNGALPASGLQVNAPDSSFSHVAGCNGTLASDATCELVVRFIPRDLGFISETITVHFFDGQQNRTLDFTVQGAGDSGVRLQFAYDSYDVGSISIGSTQVVDFEIRFFGALIAGDCDLELRDPEVTLPSGGPGSGPGDGGFSLPDGDPFGGGGTCKKDGIHTTCTVRIVFTPVVEAVYSTTLVLSYDDGTGERRSTEIILTGSGVLTSPAILDVVGATPVDFGRVPVNGTNQKNVEIQHLGELTATDISAQITGTGFEFVGGVYPGTGGTCSTTLSLTQRRCRLVVRFHPLEEGPHGGNLTLHYHDGIGTRSVSANLQGQGHHAAFVRMEAPSFPKTPLNQASTATVHLTNVGTRAATSFQVEGLPAPFERVSHNCPPALPPGAACVSVVRFTPQRPGHYSRNLRITYRNGDETASQQTALVATGTVTPMVRANGDHSCARTEIGQLKCWGLNNFGQLGLGNRTNRGDRSHNGHRMGDALPAVSLGTDRYVTDFALGHWHTCAVLDDGGVKCWGNNHYGQLGLGREDDNVGDEAGEMGNALGYVDLGGQALRLAGGYAHTCALLTDGHVKCWGYNAEGQLGLGDTVNRGRDGGDMGQALGRVPLGNAKAVNVSANASHSCALLEDRTVKCWGNNFYGQLGLGDYETRGDEPGEMGDALRAVGHPSPYTFTSVSTGGAFTCGLTTEGRIKCWGRNQHGVLGTRWCQSLAGDAGPCEDPAYPLSLPAYGTDPEHLTAGIPDVDLGDASAISLSSGTSSTCAVTDRGEVKCWGRNDQGQLGLGDTRDRGTSAEEMGPELPAVDLAGEARSITVGHQHACALLTDDSIKCWGANRYGALGQEDSQNRGDQPGQMGVSLGAVAH